MSDLHPVLELEPEVASVRRARAALRGGLRALGVDDDDTAELLLGELVTNAVLHARTAMTVRSVVIEDGDGGRRLRVEVSDGSLDPPVQRDPGPESVTGRGMYLVHVFADRLGVEIGEGPDGGPGKTVWFETLLPPWATGRATA